jgi:hypothetical protein
MSWFLQLSMLAFLIPATTEAAARRPHWGLSASVLQGGRGPHALQVSLGFGLGLFWWVTVKIKGWWEIPGFVQYNWQVGAVSSLVAYAFGSPLVPQAYMPGWHMCLWLAETSHETACSFGCALWSLCLLSWLFSFNHGEAFPGENVSTECHWTLREATGLKI